MSQTLPIRVAAILASQTASAAIQHALLAPEFALTLIDSDHWRGIPADALLVEVEDDLSVLRGICDEVTGTPIIVLLRSARADLAFAASKAAYPDIVLDAKDAHHASAEGYYLAALVIYEAIYKESVKGAPSEFYKGELIIPADQAAKLQEIADKVMAGK